MNDVADVHITELARKLDRQKNTAIWRQVRRRADSLFLEVDEELLSFIDKTSRNKRKVLVKRKVMLGLSDAEGDEATIQTHEAAVKKAYLTYLQGLEALSVDIQDLSETVDERTSLPIEIRVSVVTFTPSKLKPVLLDERARLIAKIREESEDELRIVGNHVLCREESVFVLRAKRRPLFDLLYSKAAIHRGTKRTKEGEYTLMNTVCRKTGYKIDSLRSVISKLCGELNTNFLSQKVRFEIRFNGSRRMCMIVYYED